MAACDISNVRPSSLSPCFPALPTRPAAMADAGQVRLGGMGPSFPPAIADKGKVQLGGMGPVCLRAVADAGKVRLGGMGPLL